MNEGGAQATPSIPFGLRWAQPERTPRGYFGCSSLAKKFPAATGGRGGNGKAPMTRTYLNSRHVCDGGDVGCSSRRRVRSNMSILQGLPTKKCAQSAPSLRVAARTVVCCVTLLDHIDIWPSSGALHTVRPGHNAS